MTTDNLGALLDQLAGGDLATRLAEIDPETLRTVADHITTPSELRRVLELSGDDDALIDEFVTRAGTDSMLDRVFTLMATRFLADRVGADGGVVEWHIATPDGTKEYQLAIADGAAEGVRGTPGKPRTTLAMSGPDLLRLCAGTLQGVTAFMTGKIKLTGDMMFGAKLPAAFNTDG